MLKASNKYFTFIKKGFGYTFKMVTASMSGEGHTTFRLRKIFDDCEKEGYKYIPPCEYDNIYNSLFYFRRNEED